ncbi:MAG: hypothetical protein IPO27_06980 [Bacteroidetes bacterium]|nr:hypothetical protein [Bacteroidota bacterium]
MKQKIVRLLSIFICLLLLVATTGIVHVSHFCQMETTADACCEEGDNSCEDGCNDNCCTTHICVTQLSINGLLSVKAFSISEKIKILPASVFSFYRITNTIAALQVFTTNTVPIILTGFKPFLISLRI